MNDTVFLMMLAVLRQAHEDVCSLHCPSVKKEDEEWTHSERCKAVSAVIVKAEEALIMQPQHIAEATRNLEKRGNQ